jgi:steroid delta-isomerase-like uncharacterized protein
MPTTEENKALVRRFWDELNKGNIDAMIEMIAPNAEDHSLPPGFPAGREGVRQLIAMYLGGFPDLHFTIEDMIAEGDKVVSRITNSGTNTGEFMGMPATGKTMTVSGIDIIRVGDDGKLAEHWSNGDDLGMMQQLGIIPMPDQAQAPA